MGGDDIEACVAAEDLNVQVNDTTITVAAADVHHIIIFGGSGNDLLDGGYGVDHLFGQSGNDVLIGGPGTDFLDGGTGRDVIWAIDWYVDFIHSDNDDIVFRGLGDVLV
ncbi:MAG: hypothetical protein HQ581_18600 [Planctomycetes bacterium]|nr:hypothetical protein [Planctomycetota bacterium]